MNRHKNKLIKIGYNIGTLSDFKKVGIHKSSVRKADRSRVERKLVRRFKKKFKKTYKQTA